MTYQPGEIVDIAIEDATVLDADKNGMQVEYDTADGQAVRCAIPFGKHVHVKRLVPAEGPPKDGEVWEDARGDRYVAVAHYGDLRGQVRLHDGKPGTKPIGFEPAYVHQNRGPIRRVLAAGQDSPSDEITPDIAKQVLWWFGNGSEGGVEPPTSEASLINAIVHSDPDARRRLAKLLPGYVQAVHWAEADGGIDDLRQIAERAS